MKRSSGVPSASPRAHRKSCSAARLKNTMCWFSSTVMIASIAESTIAASRAWLASVRSSATSTSRAATTMPAPITTMSEMIAAPSSHGESMPRMNAMTLAAGERGERRGSGADHRRMAEETSFDRNQSPAASTAP